MSIIAPQSKLMEIENEPYEKLIKIRDKVIRRIRYFEKNREKILSNISSYRHPTPDVLYWWNLQYLAGLCKIISEKHIDLIHEFESQNLS